LSSRLIPVEKKIEVVSRTIIGENIQSMAREVGVCRSSILFDPQGKRRIALY